MLAVQVQINEVSKKVEELQRAFDDLRLYAPK
jgi:hypothetical protein